MLIQALLIYFLLAVVGVVFCLYAWTDPNEVPKQPAKSTFPVGLAMLGFPVGSIVCAWGLASAGKVADSYCHTDFHRRVGWARGPSSWRL